MIHKSHSLYDNAITLFGCILSLAIICDKKKIRKIHVTLKSPTNYDFHDLSLKYQLLTSVNKGIKIR